MITARLTKDSPEYERPGGVHVYRLPAWRLPKLPIALNFPWLNATFCPANLRRIDAILETVPARAREAVKMHRIAGYTLEEVAEQLDVSINTAHRLVREALVEIAVALASTDA